MKSIWVIFILLLSHLSHAQMQQFSRFERQEKVSYGEIKRKKIQVMEGDLVHFPMLSGKTLPLSEVTLLLPSDSPPVFAVTVGNDLTGKSWQAGDLQWMRAKASDGFGPISPIMTPSIDYNNALLTTQLNGKIVQQENTRNMIHKPAKVVSYLSHYLTLYSGDLIFMGMPRRTQSLTKENNVSVTIEQVGTVFNTIRSHRL